MGHGLAMLGLAILLGCEAAPEAPPPLPSPPKPALADEPPTTRVRVPAPPPPELCPLLARVMEREAAGFATLRGAALADDRWSAMAILPGTEHCTVRGLQWPSARYACASALLGSDVSAWSHFDALARDLDDCLAKPIWFPRIWQRGEPFEFAMGERMLIWTDRSTAPPTQVVLKVQRAIDGPDYRVMVDLGAVP